MSYVPVICPSCGGDARERVDLRTGARTVGLHTLEGFSGRQCIGTGRPIGSRNAAVRLHTCGRHHEAAQPCDPWNAGVVTDG